MLAPALKVETENAMNERTALQEKVEHLDKNVSEIKSDIKRLDGKVDTVNAALTDHRVETERNFARVNQSIADLRVETMTAIATSIAGLRDETKSSIAALRDETRSSIAGLRDETRSSIAALREETRSAIAALREETVSAIGQLRVEMTKGFGDLRVEMRDLIESFRRDRRTLGFAMIGTIIAAVGTAAAVARWVAAPPHAPLIPAPSTATASTTP